MAQRPQHGGAREGAGRPNLTGRKGHTRRPKVSGHHPVHIAIRLERGLPQLRRKEIHRIWRKAVRTARKNTNFAAVHFALLNNHVHFISEPRTLPTQQMQSLCISFAKRLNHALRRQGRVFQDRYMMKLLKTPGDVARALAYVLTNESRHKARPANEPWQNHPVLKDPYSSAPHYRKWGRLLRTRTPPPLKAQGWTRAFINRVLEEILTPARTPLLRWIA